MTCDADLTVSPERGPLLARVSPSGPVEGRVRPPGSKSITNRALLLAALARGETRLVGALEAADTLVMREALLGLGVQVEGEVLHGCGGELPAAGLARAWCGASGTTARFLLPLAALRREGRTLLDGEPQLRRRPMGPGVEMLRAAGVEVTCLDREGYLPLEVAGGTELQEPLQVSGSLSSQFLSGLLLSLAARPGSTRVQVTGGPRVSASYVAMTCAMLDQFGVEARTSGEGLRVTGGPPRAPTTGVYVVEADASSASYFLAAAALTGGEVQIEGLPSPSLQADARCGSLLRTLATGVRELDLLECPDLAMTLAVVAAFGDRPVWLTGLQTLRYKECDRLAVLARELQRLGAQVEEGDSTLRVIPARPYQGPLCFDPQGDHRMAMSFALCGLLVEGVVVQDAGVVAKTYPGYWQDLQALCGAVSLTRQP